MNVFEDLKLVNMKEMAKIAKVPYSALYFRKLGRVKKPMDLKDRTKLVNAFFKKMKPFFLEMGFIVVVTPIEPKS
jgi:predicted transcriptional regulator